MSIFNNGSRKQKKAARNKAKAGKEPAMTAAETSPQKVGVVSSILPLGSEAEDHSPFSDVVAKRFSPTAEPQSAHPAADMPMRNQMVEPTMAQETNQPKMHFGQDNSGAEMPEFSRSPQQTAEAPRMAEAPRSIETPLFNSEEPELETDPMANIGRATTITGNIVAEEDLEIHGAIEGSVRLVEHQVTVGADGLVKASVEANVVLVHGKVTGDVTAMDLIEVKPGGIVGGDVKAPRVIMHDGAVIVGGLDMSAALPSSAKASASQRKQEETAAVAETERPVLKPVGLPPVHAQQKAAAKNKVK